eukprot:11446684-Ditylum_brightwellii.AAC.1
MHADIGYGDSTASCGIKYILILVDCKSRYCWKIIKGKCKEYLEENNVCVAAAPSGRQSQNGLVEHTWQMICNMGRAYMADMRMPKCFWFWTLCHAAQVHNYMPRKLNGCFTLSFKIVHGVWSDLCILFRLFATGYFTYTQDATKECTTMELQLLQGIAAGRSNDLDCMMMFCPFNQR